MPPAISDESSDAGDSPKPIVVKRESRRESRREPIVEEPLFVGLDNDDDDDMLDAPSNNAKAEDNGDDEDEEEEDLEEDEFIVEKILAHTVDADGTLKFKVKWEGYEKKSDQTWEDEDNLRENAAGVLDDYLESVGGRESIMEEGSGAMKSKKRGRSSASTPANGKRRRNEEHPASATPPVSAPAWKPPQGSWEDHIETIDACHDEPTGKLIVYLTWKDGHKTQHDTKVIYSRCPQKMLQFYERHVKIVSTGE